MIGVRERLYVRSTIWRRINCVWVCVVFRVCVAFFFIMGISSVLPDTVLAGDLAGVVTETPADIGETVILLHGANRTRASMWLLGVRFRQAGYPTLNFPYSNTVSSMDEISANLVTFIKENVATRRYHLIGHSLGNIIVRHTFITGFPPGLCRIVMLAPPNHPVKLAEMLRDNVFYRLLAGDGGQKLALEEYFQTLPIPPVQFGVIAGDKSSMLLIEERNDGRVEIRNTILDHMTDFTVVHQTHTFMMNTGETFDLCRRFIETGSF